MLESVKKAVFRLFPELSAGLHLDRYARVTAVNDTPGKGAVCERFRPRYSVDLTILTPELEPDPAYPVYGAVPLPAPYAAGEESGLFAFPEPGALAVIGFAYGRPDHPVIRQIYPLGASLPQVGPKEIVLQQGPDVFARADDAGNWHKAARFTIAEKSQTRRVEAIDYIVNTATELKKISQHSVTEVQGIASLEAALVDLLGAIKVDIGTLGELNLTAGADSTLSAAGNHTETIGGTRFNVTKGNDVESIAGSAERNIGGDSSLTITGGLSFASGGDVEASVGGNHSFSAAASSETVAGAKAITGADLTLSSAGVVMALGAKLNISSGGGTNIFDELLECLDNVILAESELAKGSDAAGQLFGKPEPYITLARRHWNNLNGALR